MRPWLDRLVDDASTLPPADRTVPDAVGDHRQHLIEPYAGVVRTLVVPDTRLADLTSVVSDDAPLRAHVHVTGGAGALEPACAWAGRAPGLEVVSLGIVLRDEQDLARNAARVVAMLDHVRAAGTLVDEVPLFVEPPRVRDVGEHAWGAALDELAMADLRLTLRTGGAHPDDVPTPGELAAAIDGALDRELPWRCTGGLHHAAFVPGRHGFLNALLAARTALDGGDVAAALADTDPLASFPDDDALVSARRWFTGFGTTRLLDVHEDLVGLGLL